METSASAQQAVRTFIVMDGALTDVPLMVYRHDDEPWFDQLYRGTKHSDALAISPCLICPSENSRLWDHQEEWGSSAVGVRAAVPADQLIDHLRSLISVRLPNGQQSYCRFYSNRHIRLLMDAFSEQEARNFSGPITTWFSTHPTAPFDEIQLDGSGQVRTADDEGWFHLKREHLDVLNRTHEREFSQKLCRHVGVRPDVKAMETAKNLRIQAQEFGFVSEREVATFAELAWGKDEQLASSECQKILCDTNSTAYQKLVALDRQIAYGDA